MFVIVLGLGVIGSSAAYQLARRGHKVLALDANQRGHNLGSSHGRTRITRQAYFEAPEYVPLVQHAQTVWQHLEAESGKKLYSQIGAIFVGEENGLLVQGSLESARLHDLPHELLRGKEISKRYPAFNVPDHAVALLEPNAGILHADQCLTVLQDKAVELGAQLCFNEAITSWASDGKTVTVKTTRGETHVADGLVIAAGPWTPQVLPDLQLPLSVRRVLSAHFEHEDHPRFAASQLPVWCIEFNKQFIYGFPSLSGQGLKVGRHDDGERCTADSVRRTVSRAEMDALMQTVNRYLPGAAVSVREPLTCLYTDTPDSNFILDRHMDYSNVVFMTGCSGHSFKFGPALGLALCEILTNGGTHLPVQFLSPANRFKPSPNAVS